jgi:hypothetical protein
MVPVTIFCSVRVAVTIVATFALQSGVLLDESQSKSRRKRFAS